MFPKDMFMAFLCNNSCGQPDNQLTKLSNVYPLYLHEKSTGTSHLLQVPIWLTITLFISSKSKNIYPNHSPYSKSKNIFWIRDVFITGGCHHIMKI